VSASGARLVPGTVESYPEYTPKFAAGQRTWWPGPVYLAAVSARMSATVPPAPPTPGGFRESSPEPLLDPHAGPDLFGDPRTADFPVYAPGQEIDATPFSDAPPTRGLRPRRRSRFQRILIGLSGGTFLLIVGGVLALATVLSPIGARRASTRSPGSSSDVSAASAA